MHTYQDTEVALPHNGTWEYTYWDFAIWWPPGSPTTADNPPRPGMSAGCSWAYKLLPYFEQQNLYNTYNFTTPIKTFMDPGRGGTGLSSIAPDPTQFNAYYTFDQYGQVTDYAANDIVFGSAQNTSGPPTSPTFDPNWSGPVGNWHPFNRTIQKFTDGSSNTVLLGIKAMATQVYTRRGPGNFTLSNGTTAATDDDTIAASGPGVMGLVRGICPDTVWYAAGPMDTSNPDITYIPGNTYGVIASWQSWYGYSFQVLQDAPDRNAYNAWGSPYSGGEFVRYGRRQRSVDPVRRAQQRTHLSDDARWRRDAFVLLLAATLFQGTFLHPGPRRPRMLFVIPSSSDR